MYASEDFTNNGYTEIISKSRKCSKIRYDPLVASLVACFGLIFLFGIGYCIFILIPAVQNFNILIQNIIPQELNFYHQIVSQHNQTIFLIEHQVLDVLNRNNVNNFTQTLHQINLITQEMNMTQIQYDLTQIVYLLQHIIR